MVSGVLLIIATLVLEGQSSPGDWDMDRENEVHSGLASVYSVTHSIFSQSTGTHMIEMGLLEMTVKCRRTNRTFGEHC